MTQQSNLKNLKFADAHAPKPLSRICATIVVCLVATRFGSANADIIADRKAGFKGNADSMKAIAAAKSGDQGTMMAGLKNLGASCKSCHSDFKD